MPRHVEDYRRVSAFSMGKVLRGIVASRVLLNIRWRTSSADIELMVEDGPAVFRCDGIETNVRTLWRACPFGGRRLYFRCPFCGRPAVNLYIPAERSPMCRRCLGRRYRSQDQTDSDRHFSQANKLRARLAGDDERPKWMHRRTYLRILDQMNDHHLAAFLSIRSFAKAFAGTIGMPK